MGGLLVGVVAAFRPRLGPALLVAAVILVLAGDHGLAGAATRDPVMSDRSGPAVTILLQPHLHTDAVRVDVACRYVSTGLTAVPGPMPALTRPQLVTAAVFEHEAVCGACDTEAAHGLGDPHARDLTERASHELLVGAQRRYDEGRWR